MSLSPEQGSSTPPEHHTLLDIIRRRSVVRSYLSDPIEHELLELLAEAACSAPSGGNRQPLRFIIIQEPQRLRRIIAAAPGIYGEPTAIVAVCIDWARSPHLNVDDPRDTHSTYVDVGAAMQNMLLMAEALDLGACPVMSMHRPSLQTILELPQDWTPYVLIALGWRAQRTKRAPSNHAQVRLREDVFWQRFEEASDHGG